MLSCLITHPQTRMWPFRALRQQRGHEFLNSAHLISAEGEDSSTGFFIFFFLCVWQFKMAALALRALGVSFNLCPEMRAPSWSPLALFPQENVCPWGRGWRQRIPAATLLPPRATQHLPVPLETSYCPLLHLSMGRFSN